MKQRKKISKTRKLFSILTLSAMLSNVVLPLGLTHVHAATDTSLQTPSDGKFTADEVNRILDGLTPEQKASINKLTGADNSQKIHVDQKDLKSGKNINVIVQFKVDPAKIQIIKQSLEKGSASTQKFAADYTEAKQKVADAHAKFKAFITTQPSKQIIGGQQVSNNIQITREYTDAFNGVALSVPASMVETIASQADVASVWSVIQYEVEEETPSTGETATATEAPTTGKPTAGLSLMGVDKLHAEGITGKFVSGQRQGQRVKVGVLDTGIDYNHPDLYKVTHDADGHLYEGHDFINSKVDADGNVVQVDDHDPMETIYPDWEAARENPNPLEGAPSPNYKDYITEHGTHVSGTIAASTTNNNNVYSADGVAPDVELHGYRVLGPGGHGSSYSVLSGIDQAVKDKMDVINLSLGATINDPFYPTSIAINNATLQGVVCSVSAGNAGPGASTVGSPGTSPLAITVGASTVPEQIPVQTLNFGNTPYQARLFGKNFADADDAFKGLSIPIVDVGRGSQSDYNGLDLSGKIALVKRGSDYLSQKMAYAKASGAKGMIIWDNQADEDSQGYIPNFLGISADNIYAVSITQAQGEALVDAIKADPKNAEITFPMTLDAPLNKSADELASFSSTGPVKDWSIKPDVIAPGVDIFSTVPYDTWEPNSNKDYKYSYESMSGTSMAAPHVTGISALVLAAHPDYTPSDVKTALMNTAKDVNTDSKTYSVYQVGAGRVDPVRAVHSDIKIQVLDKATSITTIDGQSQYTQIDNTTGSFSFGFNGRGEGAKPGSDDVVKSKEFTITNQGSTSKTFKLSSKFFTTKFASSNPVGEGTGNNVKIDFSTGDTNVTSLSVDGSSSVKAKATITVPANAIDGTYEGYVNVVNTNDENESYRLPFTITVAEKGIDFKVDIKAMTLTERYTGNYNPNGGQPGSGFYFSVNSAMDSVYVLLKDKDGNYIGVVQNVSSISGAGPGIIYGPIPMLLNGLYLPFTKPYNGSLDQSSIGKTPAVLKEGVYSVEMIATDKDGKKFTKEDNLYVDYKAPTLTMDSDSQPGIYEIDPTGYNPGQEVKKIYGTVYDSNIDVMKNNGETTLKDYDTGKPAPVDQGQNTVFGYQDGPFVSKIYKTDGNGRFNFGLEPDDIKASGMKFVIYPSDYAGAGDWYSTKKKYYFIKKGSPYLTVTTSGGVDPELESKGNVVVEPNKPFKVSLATKNGNGMTGGTFTINADPTLEYSNIKLSDEYVQYLSGKDITPTLTVGQPYLDRQTGRNSIDVTISGISEAGALTQDMKILEADMTFKYANAYVGPIDESFAVDHSNFTFAGKDTAVPAFPTNMPLVKQPNSQVTGGLFAESFRANSLSGSFTNITKDSGATVTAKDADGNEYVTDNSSDANTVQIGNQTAGTYSILMKVSDKPYSIETYMPGHFKGYQTTPVIGYNKFGYQSGSYFNFASMNTPLLLGGDVNGDNVIDMKDLVSEIQAYADFDFLKGVSAPSKEKAEFFTNSTAHRNNDISWAFSGLNAFGNYSFSNIDYSDFYYIFKNFGQKNQSAIAAGKVVPEPQLTLPENLSITSNRGTYTDSSYNSKVKTYNLSAGNGLDEVMAMLNFAGPTQKTSVTQLPTFQDLKNGSTVSLIPTSNVMLDDVVWRNKITKVELGQGGNFTDVTNAVVPNTTDQAVSITSGYTKFDPQLGNVFVPATLKLHGSLFNTTGTYTVRITAAGYQLVTTSFTIASVPIPTPTIPIVTDPAKAHIGNDITFNYTFAQDTNWRNGINRIVVKTSGFKTGLDITNLKDGNGNYYYDLSKPGQITFKAALFKTDAKLDPKNSTSYNAAINPGGANFLPQLYRFEIDSTGVDGTIYPTVTIGGDGTAASQPIGYGITFDSKGGNVIDPFAVGFNPGNSRYGSSGNLMANSTSSNGFTNPKPVRPGYAFAGWYKVDPATNELTTLWSVADILTSDLKIAAKWQVSYTQNYSAVDQSIQDGDKLPGLVLGEGPLKIVIPDYKTTAPWLKTKSDITKIDATYNKMKEDGSGTFETTTTTYTLDPSTYQLVANDDGSDSLTFTTETEAYATAHPSEMFAFSHAPSFNGYQLTVTSATGETIQIPNVKLGYRRHIDLNGGTLNSSGDAAFFSDKLVNGKAYGIDMLSAAQKVKNGTLSMMPSLYYDAAGTSGQTVPISTAVGKVLKNNETYYIVWMKTPPQVTKDVVGNIVGSDITLAFTDDGTWRNNIKKVSIGSKELNVGTEYKITYDSVTHKGSITLDKSLFTAGQKVNVNISSEGYTDATVTDQVIGYTVTFETNGGDAIDPQIVDSRVEKPTDPTKVGFKFMGWYSDEALTTPYDFTSVVTKPMKLYAKYALATSIVSADTTDNALGNEITLEFSDRDWANAITNIKVAGSTIDATNYKIDATHGTLTIDQSVFKKTGEFIISISANEYADVTVTQKIVNGNIIHFILIGEKAPFEVKDQIVVRRITEPTVYGYDLTWYADENCTIPWDFTNSIYSAKTIYGKWSPTKFTVIFDRQDGGLVQSKTAEYKTTITAPNVPTRPGYTFVGWYKDATGENAWNFATEQVTANTILYAKWSINSYTVSFNSQGGSAVDSKTVVFNTTVGEPTAPTRPGYTFVGWYKDATGENAWNFATEQVTANTILYAKWSINSDTVSSYTVSFNSQGGSAVDSKTVVSNTTVGEPTAPTRPGYTFVGWYKDATGQNAWNFATEQVTGNTILYAKWSINSYTVSFNSQGGSAVDSKTVVFNTTVGEPTAPTRPGYTFVGWFKDATGQNAWNFATEQVTANTILYAKWSINSYTVSFNSQGGSAVDSKTVVFNTTVGEPTAPTRPGYTFVGWYKDATGQNAWNFATDNVTANTILYAKWSINSYTVSFNSQGGSAVDSKTVVYNTTVGEPTAPRRKGYTFIGWYKDAKGQTAWNFATDTVSGNVTLYAKWLPIGPVINPVDDNDTTISGKTEANATVVVKNKDVVVATGKANAEGIYSIKITPQKAGTVLTVIATDAEGNQSEASLITVLDRTAPNAPSVNAIDDNDTKITGKAEANATIVVKNNGNTIATGKADSKGFFTINMNRQKAGTVLSVNATDAAGNRSASTNVKVLDRTAPKAPKITSFIVKNKNQIQISGTAEANSTIIVKINNKVVTNVKVSSKGTFTVKLSKVGKGKNTVTLQARDIAGNSSNVVSRSVTIK
ncbi:InlB B-repeat-containing protein [Bacillus sp. RG28]|uniref:InlB B-repeat-containing protein n=1 Tax=Gottfriedia endophytica TaxID=2820819 RepID=A0A940SJV6_9BACI|nr:InlB B-repeat-containing protein [Gottfriedia endophytica]MBP0724623.1 InlB B-repeat-containing protein [Gottfriedia endophytica]